MIEIRSDIQIAELSAHHAPQMFKWMKEPSVTKNIGLRTEPSIEKTVSWITNVQNSAETRAFAITSSNRHIGNCILDKIDDYLLSARFSIYIGELNLRKSGVGRTAGYLLCDYGFKNLSLNKIWLTVHAKNFRAINTYSRIGFKLEGILREEFLLDGEKIDAVYMGLLKEEFEKQKFVFV